MAVKALEETKGQTRVKGGLERSNHRKMLPFSVESHREETVFPEPERLEPWWRFPGRNWDRRGGPPGQKDCGFYPPGCGPWDLGKCGLQGSASCGRERKAGGEEPGLSCLTSR